MNEIVVAQPHQITTMAPSIFMNIQGFEDGLRMAKIFASSKMVPEVYRNNLADCLIALELSMRIDMSPMAVMQSTHVIHGKPGYSAQFIIAMVNSCGKFSPLRYDETGEGDKQQCIAWAKELATGQRLDSPPVSIAMAKAEGWFQKKGSKWQTLPELMLRYRAATFFGRLYAPDLLMGMRSTEELHDTGASENNEQSDSSIEKLNQTFNIEPPKKLPAKKKKATEKPPEAIDVEPGPDYRPLTVKRLIADIAMISSLKTMETWMAGADEILNRELAVIDDQEEVRAFISEHHATLTEREKEAPQVEQEPDYLSRIEGDEVVPHDPEVPYAHFQREARRQKTPVQLDKWRMTKFQEFEKVMSDEELADFLNWVQILYDSWLSEEA